MKVLFVINQLFRGGAEGALINLLSAMRDKKYQIDLLVYDQIDLPDTVSLIPKVPSYVKLYNIAKNEKKVAFVKKAFYKVYNKMTGRTAFRRGAYKVLEDNEYDVAISFGEWFSCSLVANYAKARWKYVWIHADADKADFFHPDIYRYHECFDGFIFVSNNSRLSAERQYSFIAGRSYIVNNMIDADEVLEKSKDKPCITLPEDGLPRLVTVANVRPEKNHLRQLRVMKRLFDRGLRFYWINVGSTANSALMGKLTAEIRASGLEEYCLFTGAVENPYSVIRNSDAVCVLSDHESWSMVITETKTLGTPVIATKTSGALEQLVHLDNGILCDFDEGDIEEKIEEFLKDPGIGENIRKNLRGFSSTANVLASLDALFENRKKLLYVFDDINYMSGARAATLMQADCLRESWHVDLFSVTAAKDEELLSKYRIINIENNERFKILSVPIREALSSAKYSKRSKLLRIAYAVLVRLGMDIPLYRSLLKNELTHQFCGYDCIIVVSEASKLRHFVSTLSHPRKIQWIHTDYVAWRLHSSWTKKITRNDGATYKKYDKVVCLSEALREKFASLYPLLAEKTVAIPNLIDYDGIIEKSLEPCEISVDKSKLNIITIGRMESEKRYDRILSLARELSELGNDFTWYLVGDGTLLEDYKTACAEMGLEGRVIFTGYLDNACPLLKQCDLFVLLSEYEGTPVTVDEAKVLGVPVLAKNVGGISDMLGPAVGRALSSVSAADIADFDTSSCIGVGESEIRDYNKETSNKIKSIL
ncbi:MAG: glycosyltransferase [Clostridia bacterium]|nr:glycosyltransferase [Clostridia bacterium]